MPKANNFAPKAKRAKSTVSGDNTPLKAHNFAPKGTKVSAVEREMNTALSLIESHRNADVSHREQDGTKTETLSSQRLSEFERGKRKETGLAQYKLISAEKHTDNMRHKIAYVADQLIEEMAHEVSKKTKKDKEYLKGLTWSFGVLHDKLTAVNTEATLVSLPTKLLAAVKDVITAQVEVAKAHAVNLVASAELAKQNAVVSTELRSIQQGASTTQNPNSDSQEPIDVTPVVQDTSKDYVSSSHDSTSPERSVTQESLPT